MRQFLPVIFLVSSCVFLPVSIFAADGGVRAMDNDSSESKLSLSENVDDGLQMQFPSLEKTHEMAYLSSLVYKNSKKDPKLPGDYELEYYEDRLNTGNVMVISSQELKQVVVTFAGSDGINDWMDDMDITQEPFGPKLSPINRNTWVHSGFNNVLFYSRVYEKDNMYDRIKKTVFDVLQRDEDQVGDYRVIISGHSLGGALSVLTGAAFANHTPERDFLVINFGCPRLGSKKFHRWSNKMQNLAVWRFVYHRDIVPRIPSDARFYHTGHTVQLESDTGAKAYYHHKGSEEKGLAGVPSGWNDGNSSSNHSISNYVSYLEEKSYNNPDMYFVDSFVVGTNNVEEEEKVDSFIDSVEEATKSFLRKTKSKAKLSF